MADSVHEASWRFGHPNVNFTRNKSQPAMVAVRITSLLHIEVRAPLQDLHCHPDLHHGLHVLVPPGVLEHRAELHSHTPLERCSLVDVAVFPKRLVGFDAVPSARSLVHIRQLATLRHGLVIAVAI